MDQTDVVIDGLTADPLLARHEFVEQRVLIAHLRTEGLDDDVDDPSLEHER